MGYDYFDATVEGMWSLGEQYDDMAADYEQEPCPCGYCGNPDDRRCDCDGYCPYCGNEDACDCLLENRDGWR